MFPRTVRALAVYGDTLRERYREELSMNNRPTQYNDALRSTAEYIVEVNGTTLSVTLMLQEYWKYVENGTRPHWPPRKPIEDWIRVKPVVPHADSKGRVPKPKQLAFLIARKISEKGTPAGHELGKAVENTKGALINLNDEIAADLTENIDAIFKTFSFYK